MRHLISSLHPQTEAMAAMLRRARLQSFQLAGDTILDLLTDSPEAARLMDLPQGVMVEGRKLPLGSSHN